MMRTVPTVPGIVAVTRFLFLYERLFIYYCMMNTKHDICSTHCFHPDLVSRTEACLQADEVLRDLSQLFRVLGDHTRTRILDALSHAELCVCDLTVLLGMNQSAVSHQLRLLRAAKIVKSRKEGKNVYYSLDDMHIQALMMLGLEHVKEA